MPGSSYDVKDIVNKSLTATRDVPIFNLPIGSGGKQISTVRTGNPLGVVHSWVIDKKDGAVWWQFKDALGRFIYAKHDANSFSTKTLREQGAKSIKEKVEEEKNRLEVATKPWWEKMISHSFSSDIVNKLVMYGVGAYVVVNIFRAFLNSKNDRHNA